VIEHGFTHFGWISCRYAAACFEKSCKGKANGFWLDVADAVGAAVPAPVRVLLSGLLRDQAL
jgi:hypothetical protein